MYVLPRLLRVKTIICRFIQFWRLERAYFGAPQGTEFSIATQQGTRNPTDGQERNHSLEVGHHETQVKQP